MVYGLWFMVYGLWFMVYIFMGYSKIENIKNPNNLGPALIGYNL